mmetsp:Transcript_6455/g.18286  ORF Transcript_6455/g.18286 Transcript_6455/m.18286 type:complete len:217 (-) Transcript_6455:202-852(-)
MSASSRFTNDVIRKPDAEVTLPSASTHERARVDPRAGIGVDVGEDVLVRLHCLLVKGAVKAPVRQHAALKAVSLRPVTQVHEGEAQVGLFGVVDGEGAVAQVPHGVQRRPIEEVDAVVPADDHVGSRGGLAKPFCRELVLAFSPATPGIPELYSRLRSGPGEVDAGAARRDDGSRHDEGRERVAGDNAADDLEVLVADDLDLLGHALPSRQETMRG